MRLGQKTRLNRIIPNHLFGSPDPMIPVGGAASSLLRAEAFPEGRHLKPNTLG